MFRRLGSGAAAVLVVGLTSVGVIVSSTPALALQAPPKPPPIAVKALPGVLKSTPLRAVTKSPVGRWVGIAVDVANGAQMLGSTVDTYLDRTADESTAPGNNSTPAVAGATGVDPCVALNPIVVTGNLVQVAALDVCNTSGGRNFGVDLVVTCKTIATFIEVTRSVFDYIPGGGQNVVSQECGAGSVPVGARTTPKSGAQSPANHVSWAGEGMPTDQGSYTVTNTCAKPDGSTEILTVTTGPDSPWKGIKVPSCTGVDVGATSKGVTVDLKATPGSTPQRVWDVTPDKTDPAYPECPQGGVLTCQWDVELDGQKCVYGASRCDDWARRAQTDPRSVRCLYGPYVLPTARCYWLEGAYRTGGATNTRDDTDGDPDTRYDPKTGGNPGSDPGTGTGTGTGTGGPVPAGDPVSDPNTSTDDRNACWPSGFGAFNPANWVLQPTKCAFRWAFIPPKQGEAFIDWWDVNKDRFNGSPLGSWSGALNGWAIGFAALGSGGGGCQGPPVSTGFMGRKGVMPGTIYPFEACSGVKATAAATSKMILTASIVWFTGWKLVRIVGRPFGYDLDLMRQDKGGV